MDANGYFLMPRQPEPKRPVTARVNGWLWRATKALALWLAGKWLDAEWVTPLVTWSMTVAVWLAVWVWAGLPWWVDGWAILALHAVSPVGLTLLGAARCAWLLRLPTGDDDDDRVAVWREVVAGDQ